MMQTTSLLLILVAAFIDQPCYASKLPYAGNMNGQGNDSSCAPGFSGTPCKCDASKYKGMTCYEEKAYVLGGYWFGECENGIFCTGECQLGYCVYNGSTDLQLPGSISELDEYMCGPTRTGVLCGECRANYSAKYHSLECVSDDSCNYGILLYIVSELLPLTVLFIIVIAFNISFTSGAVNGFIFFVQIEYLLDAHPALVFQRRWYAMIYPFVYEFFNFSFFGIKELSFCLWKGAAFLDTLALKYVTIVYALLLVFLCVFIVNSSKVKRCFPCLRPTTLRSTLIHGLTAFFVICYSQCARVSFGMLWSASLYTKDGHLVRSVVFANGELSMFEPRHLKYAIPALIFMSTMVLLPPVLLILYPLMFKILARCNLSESKPVNCLSRLVPMQLLDSFQSCFRDNVRFFAGLYFIYRLVPHIIWSISMSIDDYIIVHSSLTVIFVLILALHAAVQPYKQRIHNVVDVVMFSDLLTISALSLSKCQSTDQEYYILSGIQLALFYLPQVYLLSIVLFRLLKAVVRCCKTENRSSNLLETTQLLTDSCDLPPLRKE